MVIPSMAQYGQTLFVAALSNHIDEMAQCQNCYYMSNAKPRHWFAQPCDPPHELVYAKLKGYSYWPAKVIHYINEERYDVRFFGNPHQRAVIPKDQIKPIDADLKKVTFKKTTGFNKSMEELKIHQKLLQEQEQRAEEEDNEDEEEEEEQHTTVSSTSISTSKAAKRKRVSVPDDVVTSTEEYQPSKSMAASTDDFAFNGEEVEAKKEPHKPPKKRSRLSTNNTASQTSKKATTTVSSTQTEEQTIDTATPSPSLESSPSLSQSVTDTPSKTDEVKSDEPPVLENEEEKTCNCASKHSRLMVEQKERMEKHFREEKARGLEELSERLRKDFEEDKQQAVSRAMSKLQAELDKVRRQTEEKCKEQYKDEMKKLAQKHKETISATKKKQWCFNCEEEAMYHCCWNTSYCSVKCQQEHWHKEHKRVCRRKR
ncbi:zinc finger MYND domain-containing protein 11-like [Mya arenaria]|uniref:zinc finger MYND domain-containing protein 11-like n=1 Tax=Mya arenaria TaxID=6604 RepID=UPI0022E73998|nr:zinc finger MYND domain-containing protein 11-like [Mya arenaria]